MNVAIDEAGKDKLSAAVDDLCARPAQFFDFGNITDRDDLFAANGHRVRPSLLRVFGVDLSVEENGVCGLEPRILGDDCSTDAQSTDKGKRQGDHEFARGDHSWLQS